MICEFCWDANIISNRNNKVTMHWNLGIHKKNILMQERGTPTAYYINKLMKGFDYINARKKAKKLLNEDNIKFVSLSSTSLTLTLIADGGHTKKVVL